MNDMEWKVYTFDLNSRKLREFNVFHHAGFRDDVQKELARCQNVEDFAPKLKSSLMYYFWSKCEWEIVLKEWCASNGTEVKVDVYDQVMLNWDVFLEYVWAHRKRRKGQQDDRR